MVLTGNELKSLQVKADQYNEPISEDCLDCEWLSDNGICSQSVCTGIRLCEICHRPRRADKFYGVLDGVGLVCHNCVKKLEDRKAWQSQGGNWRDLVSMRNK